MLSLVALVAFSFTQAAPAVRAEQPAATSRAAAECAFGADRLRDFTQGKGSPTFFLSDRPVYQAGLHAKDAAMATLVTAYKARPASNLFTACPHLRSLIPPHIRIASESEVAELLKLAREPGSQPPQVTILGLGAPFISEDGQTVLFETSTQCRGLCGHGGVTRYVRGPKGWVRKDSLSFWIS